MSLKRRRFDREFKKQAVRLASEEGQSTSQVARDLGIGPELLRRWKRVFDEEGERAFPGEGRARDEDMARLRRDLRRVTEERDILKKAVAIFSERRR
jgi:transposase